jgi:oxygen-independent coproporphyrinogen-3 oxidase
MPYYYFQPLNTKPLAARSSWLTAPDYLRRMSGIYLHIPFCKKACHYCNFHFSTSRQQLPAMVEAICKEIVLQHHYLVDEVQTIYFGGGTPSLLAGAYIRNILEHIHKNFRVSAAAEITLEANPDDINSNGLNEWKEAGINRLSIGIQSFFEEDLQWMNRAHNAMQARQCIEIAQAAGFSNITIDLIYGTPGLSDEKWKQNVETALSLNIPHLSCYALTVEPKTALAKMIASKQSRNIELDDQARQFELLTQWLSAAGFEHYEISNFAKPGFRSRHNSSYWQGKPYLGIGPSAHSFNGRSRQWNIANNAVYIATIDAGSVPFEIEVLTTTQQLNEYLMTALRTIEGISVKRIGELWGDEKALQLIATAQKHIERGHLAMNDERLQLTEKGKFLADGIAADLFETEEDAKNDPDAPSSF